MSSPSPFEIGRQVGTNFYNTRREARDQSAIEGILSQAIGSGDPAVLQSSIGKILSQVSPERQGAAIKYLENAYTNIQERQKEEQQFKREKEAGLVPGVNATSQAAIFKENAKAGRLAQYGIGGAQVGQPQASGQLTGGQLPQQNTPNTLIPQDVSNPNENPITPFENFLRTRTKDQLVALTGSVDKEISEPSKAMLKQIEHEEKLSEKEKKRTRDEELQFHKESEKYDEELSKQTRTAKKQVEAVDNIDKALSSGNVSPTSLANIFRGFGKIGDKLSEALINKNEATLLASIPQLLEGWKEVFGVRLSDADLRVLQDKLPSIGKNPDANRSIVKILKKYADMTLLRSQIARDIKSKNKGIRPLGYADQIEERFDQMVAPVKIINPDTGKVVPIPAYKVSEAIEAGGQLANE